MRTRRSRVQISYVAVLGGCLIIGAILALLLIKLTSGQTVSHAGRFQQRSQSNPPATEAAPSPVPKFFSPSSIWNAPVPPNASLDPRSGAIVGDLLNQEASESLGIATRQYGVPIYTVSADQPTVHVTLDAGAAQADLQAAFNAVPIPPGAQPAQGTDGNLVVYQPSTDTMWEFWRLSKHADGWHAGWGGRMFHVSNDPGYYRNVLSPSGAVLERPLWGAPATSLALVGGVMTIGELQSGTIPHALGLAITRTCAGVFAAPAQRTDGVDNSSDCVPEGAHFRLDPRLDVASLGLPHFVYMMAVAAQKYGIIINNKSDGFTFRGEDPLQYEQAHGYDPYFGPQHAPGTPGALFSGWPADMLRLFPWSHLQLLKMDLRTHPDMSRVVELPPT